MQYNHITIAFISNHSNLSTRTHPAVTFLGRRTANQKRRQWNSCFRHFASFLLTDSLLRYPSHRYVHFMEGEAAAWQRPHACLQLEKLHHRSSGSLASSLPLLLSLGEITSHTAVTVFRW